MMGVEISDARRVATQMGLKIFLDDVLCYADLGEAVQAGEISVSSISGSLFNFTSLSFLDI